MAFLNRVTLVAFCLLGVGFGTNTYGQETFQPGDFANYVPDVKNGETIFAAAGCATCHGTEGQQDLLAGGRPISTKFGELYPPNITAHPVAGIGSWSNATFLNALLRGISDDGHRYYGAVFPFASYARMRPEDALDLRAYLAGLPQSDAPSKPHNISFLSQKILDSWTMDRGELKSMSDPQMARGQYLVEAVGHCAECHTPRDTGLGFKYDLDADRPYAGEVGLLGDYAPEISADRITGFGPEAFVNGALAQARKLNGNPMTAASMQRISAQMSVLSVEDRTAIYAYLSGTSLDPASLPGLTPSTIVSTIASDDPTPLGAQDLTNANALVSKIDAYCTASDTAKATGPKQTGSVLNNGADPSLTREADQVIENHCRSCHAPGKTYSAVFPTGDIADMPFDKRIVQAGDPDGSPLYESIASNRMPLGQKMTASEVDVLRRWIAALAPSSGATVKVELDTPEVSAPLFAGGSRSERMLAMATDIASVPERDRPFTRYFSFANTPLATIDCSEVGAKRNPMVYLHAALNKFINSVSLGSKPVAATPVDGTDGAIVRIDMRDYGWERETWDALTTGLYTQRASDSGFSPEAWKDLASNYPYAIDPRSDPLLGALAEATKAAVPIMRADWFTHFASEAPYYDMFLGLTAHIRDLETRLGLDVDREILNGNMIRAAMLPGASGVSDHNRMLERFDLPRGGYYWKSYDFAGDDGLQSLVLNPDGPAELPVNRTATTSFHHDGGEMIFTLPNGLQGYYLSTNTGERLLVGPASIVSFRNKPIGKGVEIENARSCFDCHANGMIAKRDQLREVIEVSQRFDSEQREKLLDLYVDNDRLGEIFRRDSADFLETLARLNATEPSATGRATSLSAPQSAGGGEIVTYLADMHFDSVDLLGLAREFYMDVPTFKERAFRTGDAQLALVLSDWIARLEVGAKLHRSEIETYYKEILPRITELRSFEPSGSYTIAENTESINLEQKIGAVVDTLVSLDTVTFAPAISAPMAANLAPEISSDRVKLAISVPETDVRVNDLLRFDISASKRCELQIFYIEGSDGIEELPQALLGPAFLEAGEVRRIPFPGSGYRLRFDAPGTNDTMLAFCREGGLGQERMTAASVMEYSHSRAQPLLRGIAIEAAGKVTDDKGSSATNFITFNVRP